MDFNDLLEIFKALFAGNEPEKVKELMESLMNTLMIIERNRHNGAENYEHSEGKRGDLYGAVHPVERTRSARRQDGDFRCPHGIEKCDKQIL